MSEKFKIKIKKVLFIVVFTTLAGAYFATIETAYRAMADSLKPGLGTHGPLFSYVAQCLAGLVGGTFFASLEIFYLRDYFRRKSFGKAILIETVIFILLFLVITLIINFIYQIIYSNANLFSQESFLELKDYFTQPGFYLNFLSWMLVLVAMLIMLQVGDKFGEGTFTKFFFGKYHEPKEEMRVFMFLDLKNSTSIAEKLGHTKYFQLLADFFSDTTDPIIYNRGEIYQYVGDEITVSWDLKNGIEKNRCIKCFFDIKNKIYDRQFYYESRYGLIPDFKAGMHFGLVTIGEIGIVKKDIVYSGDLLNTTSRIMDECKNHQKDLIISRDLSDTFEKNISYNFVELGQIELRGKERKIDLVAVTV